MSRSASFMALLDLLALSQAAQGLERVLHADTAGRPQIRLECAVLLEALVLHVLLVFLPPLPHLGGTARLDALLDAVFQLLDHRRGTALPLALLSAGPSRSRPAAR